MRLANFIDHELDAIVRRWEEFAGTLQPVPGRMDTLALRDHAEQILRAISADLRTAQTRFEQEQKSRGEATPAMLETAAQTHAVLRAASGFSVRQLVAEYRALRASVLRQYLDSVRKEEVELDDIGRFNEAMDQAVAESVDYFAAEVERWRNIFLGVLGHDLRGPLSAIQLTAAHIARKNPGPEFAEPMARLLRSGQRMADLLEDLLDFNRVTTGRQFDISPHHTDLVATCRQEVELQRSAHPTAGIEFEAPETCQGMWDTSRIRQAVGNLVSNAVKYGSRAPIRVLVERDGTDVRVAVDNAGPALDEAELDKLFDPLYRGSAGASDESRTHLGLGLFIVRQTAIAHGGTVEAHSADGRTRFSLVLPCDAPTAPDGSA